MGSIKTCQTTKLLMAVFQDTVMHIHVMKDINDCHQYFRFSLYSYKPNSYMDVIFNLDEAPPYVLFIYRFVERHNKISISDDNLSYVIQGPCLEAEKTFKISNIFIVDYHLMLKRTFEFIYDYDTAVLLSQNILLPVYDMIFRSWKSQ